jgi:hypothetical protein
VTRECNPSFDRQLATCVSAVRGVINQSVVGSVETPVGPRLRHANFFVGVDNDQRLLHSIYADLVAVLHEASAIELFEQETSTQTRSSRHCVALRLGGDR